MSRRTFIEPLTPFHAIQLRHHNQRRPTCRPIKQLASTPDPRSVIYAPLEDIGSIRRDGQPMSGSFAAAAAANLFLFGFKITRENKTAAVGLFQKLSLPQIVHHHHHQDDNRLAKSFLLPTGNRQLQILRLGPTWIWLRICRRPSEHSKAS